MFLKLGKCFSTGATVFGTKVGDTAFASIKSGYPAGMIDFKCDHDFIVVADYKTGECVQINVKENLSKFHNVLTANIVPYIQARIGVNSKGYDVISYLFDAKKFNMSGARDWLDRHKGETIKGHIQDAYEVALLFEHENGKYLLTAGNDVYVTENIVDKVEEIEASLAERNLYFREQEDDWLFDVENEDLEKLIANEGGGSEI